MIFTAFVSNIFSFKNKQTKKTIYRIGLIEAHTVKETLFKTLFREISDTNEHVSKLFGDV